MRPCPAWSGGQGRWREQDKNKALDSRRRPRLNSAHAAPSLRRPVAPHWPGPCRWTVVRLPHGLAAGDEGELRPLASRAGGSGAVLDGGGGLGRGRAADASGPGARGGTGARSPAGATAAATPGRDSRRRGSWLTRSTPACYWIDPTSGRAVRLPERPWGQTRNASASSASSGSSGRSCGSPMAASKPLTHSRHPASLVE